MAEQSGQLPLAVGLDVEARFDTFYPGPNEAAVAALKALPVPGVWLTGAQGSGRSHLLQASASACGGGEALYLPLASGLPAASVQGLRPGMLVCLDDVETVAGDEEWERALLMLYETLREQDGRLVVSALHPLQQAGFVLPDLISRFSALTRFHLRRPDDEGLLAALQKRALARGLRLADDAARFMVERLPRDLPVLFEWLSALDRLSLAARRRLSLPFVRDAITDSNADLSQLR